MKKKVLALLLGGVVAVGALSMQVPATAEAAMHRFDACEDSSSDSHINSKEVAIVDGKLTVTIDIDFEIENAYFCLYVFDEPLEKRDLFDYSFYDTWWGEDSVAKLEDLKESGVYTFDGLAGDKAYYVYCNVADNHEIFGWGECEDPEEALWHYASYLGTNGSNSGSSDNGSSNNTPSDSGSSGSTSNRGSYEDIQASQIRAAEPGSTVVMENVSTLSNSLMKELLAKGDVSLKLEFTYQEQEYVIVIPAGAALDNDISWYGPLYLAQQYGNSAGAAAPAADAVGASYDVKSGDTLSKIAAANHMTLKQLLAKNPQIKNPNKISVGQKINL